MARTDALPASRQPVPTLPSHWYRGHVPDLMCGAFTFHERLQRECGDVARFRLNNWHIFQITHPDHVECVLRGSNQKFGKGRGWDAPRQMIGKGILAVEPESWLGQRRSFQPVFLRHYHERFASTFASTITSTLPHFHQIARDGEPISILNAMAQLTLRNTNLTLFGKDIAQEKELSQHIAVMLDYVNGYFEIPWYKRTFGLYIKRTRHARFHRSYVEIRKFAQAVVEERLTLYRAGAEVPDDVLSQLLFQDDKTKIHTHSARYLTDQIMTFIFAGHETTALALTWAWWFLSQNPEVEARLHDELVRVLDGRTPKLQDLPQLPYGLTVIEEALRLRPPVWQIPRETRQNEVFNQYSIPAHSSLLLLPWVTHRHPDFWEQPEKFEPERFLPERRARQHPYAYIAFGGGPRQCIGRHTALIEVQLALSTLAQHFTFRPARECTGEGLPLITLRPHLGMPMTLHSRA